MTIQHMDNFSMYGLGNGSHMLDGVYAQAQRVNIVADPDPTAAAEGSIVVTMTGFTAVLPILRYVLSSTEAIVGICERVWMPNLPTGDFDRPVVMDFRDADNNPFASLVLETTGRITFDYAGGSFTTTNPVIGAGGWWHLEMKYDTTGAGAFELRVEGIPVIQLDSLGYAAQGPVYQVAQSYNATNLGASTIYYKDFVVWDGSGAHNTDFLGAVVIYSLIPDSDVALNWTPVGGANGFSILDQTPPDDTKFISAPFPLPAAYKATLSNLPPDVTSVKGIMSMVRAAKTDGGDAGLQNSIISDPAAPAQADGANRPITVAQTYWRDVFEVDPKTGAAWLPSAVNAAELQINRTA